MRFYRIGIFVQFYKKWSGHFSFSILKKKLKNFNDAFTWLFDNFRSHPEWCSYKCISFTSCISKLTGNSKIRQLDITHITQQYVSSLNISTIKIYKKRKHQNLITAVNSKILILKYLQPDFLFNIWIFEPWSLVDLEVKVVISKVDIIRCKVDLENLRLRRSV